MNVKNQKLRLTGHPWLTAVNRRLRRYSRIGFVGGALALILIFNVTAYLPLHTTAVGTNMMVFWDPAFGSSAFRLVGDHYF